MEGESVPYGIVWYMVGFPSSAVYLFNKSKKRAAASTYPCPFKLEKLELDPYKGMIVRKRRHKLEYAHIVHYISVLHTDDYCTRLKEIL